MRQSGAAREQVLRAVNENPGLHLRALEKLTHLPLGTLRHHLKQLERSGLLRVEFDLRFKRYFPPTMDAGLRETIAALRPRPMRRIVVLLSTRGTLTSGQIGSALQLPRSSLGLYLRRLRQKGIVDKGAGLEAGWVLKNEEVVREALAAYHSSFFDRVVDGTLEVFDFTGAADQAPPRPDLAEE